MGARIRRKDRAGFVIKITDKVLGIDTSTQTGTTKRRTVDRMVVEINANLQRLRRNELRFGKDWSGAEKLYLLKTGRDAESTSRISIKLRDAIKRYIDSRIELRRAINTIDGYMIMLANALEFFGNIKLEKISSRRLHANYSHYSRVSISSRINDPYYHMVILCKLP